MKKFFIRLLLWARSWLVDVSKQGFRLDKGSKISRAPPTLSEMLIGYWLKERFRLAYGRGLPVHPLPLARCWLVVDSKQDFDWSTAHSFPVHPLEQPQLPGIVQQPDFISMGPSLQRLAARRDAQPLLRHGHEALHAHMLGAVVCSAEHAFVCSLGAESAIFATSLPTKHASLLFRSAILPN